MRFVQFAAIALLLAPIAVQAQTAAPETTMQAPAASKPKTTQAQRFQTRFNAANTTHDGHLTLDQARANKWTSVIKSFSKVDADGKGYVTAEQLRSYYIAQRAAKAHAKPEAAPSTGTPARS
jgi:Ca2+-binding EF-hand superfamily protein